MRTGDSDANDLTCGSAHHLDLCSAGLRRVHRNHEVDLERTDGIDRHRVSVEQNLNIGEGRWNS